MSWRSKLFNIEHKEKIAKPKLISFCTTCMGRTHHLSQTIKINLPIIEKYKCQLVLVNWNSQDGLDEFIKKNYYNYIINGTLKYFHTTTPKYFHMSKAKNLAHTLGDMDYLYNLDADEFLSHEEMSLLIVTNIEVYRNLNGRIMIKKNAFNEINGYREDMLGWGSEDDDLIERCSKFKIIENPRSYVNRIEHWNKLENTEFNGRRHNTLRKQNKLNFKSDYEPRQWSIVGLINFSRFIKINLWDQ